MKNLSRDAKLTIGILVILVLITALAAGQQRRDQQESPALSSLSAAPDGALALKLWVKSLQYEVDEQVLAEFIPPKNVSILFMLEPLLPTESEFLPMDDWVEAGGTLIAIGDQYGMILLLQHYEFTLNYLPERGRPANETPLFDSPVPSPLDNTIVRAVLQSERDDFVVLAAHQGQPVLVSFEQGKGRVILGTISEPFTNAGLKKAGNPELVLNILALARVKGVVWFDEWHHYIRSRARILGPGQFLRRTPVGRSLLFATFAILVVLFIQGRGFGRPMPLPQEIKRRGAWEHVTGIANLSRRAAHRSAVMLQYHQQIKRKLGQRYRLDPSLDDRQYVDMLAGYNPSLQKEDLLNLLKRLKRKDVSEGEMVHLAAEAARWIDN